MQNRTLTIMFTDMKGFTPRTNAQSREETLQMIRQHKELLVPIIAEYGGRLVKAIGDSFLVTFESPTDAVIAGVRIQNRLHEHNAPLPWERQIEIRIAVNTGEVTLDENDVYGEAVNIASRIEGLAEPNQVYFTEATYLSMHRSEVPSSEVGYRVLKGIPEKIKLYRVLMEGEQPPPPLPTPSNIKMPLVPILIKPPAWRRLLAFMIDATLASLAVFLLSFPVPLRLARTDAALRGTAERFKQAAQTRLGPLYDEKKADEALWGDAVPGHDRVYRPIVRDFRQQRATLEQERRSYRRLRDSVTFLLLLLYQFVATAWKGRSFGKRLLGLKVVRLDGSRVLWKKSFLRTLLYLLSAGPACLGFAWILMDRKGQAWHDKIAETRVVKVES